MCEADLSSADQVVIFKGNFACLQAINLTNSTTGDLVFMGGTKFLPVGVSSQQNVVRWNSLMHMFVCPYFIIVFFLDAVASQYSGLKVSW